MKYLLDLKKYTWKDWLAWLFICAVIGAVEFGIWAWLES